jgi:hypothetical protein
LSGAVVDPNGQSVTIQNSQSAYVLNLSSNLQNFVSVGQNYPADSVYGLNAATSYSTYIKKSLAIVGYILSLLILLTHCIYIGNGLTYKMDNIIIFCQSIFYFLFTRILISNPVGQYYYGWSWIHLNFYPNYFSSLLSVSEPSTPAFALYNIDANFIRNAGFSISLMLTFLIIWGVASIICYFADIELGKQ